MKTILILIILSFFVTESQGQITRPPLFDTCSYLQPLEGEWRNVNGLDTIKIYLRFHRSFNSDPETYDATLDCLWGWIEYKHGNNVIMSDYANRFVTLPFDMTDLPDDDVSSIILWPTWGCENPIPMLSGGIEDIVLCRQNKNITATINTSGTQMTWKLVQPPAVVGVGCEGYTLPTELVLTKQ
ncbi:MAG: hypothetical protein IPL04_02165 [Chitinophagaceae bacterium]|nr:hypothetical protein [Chitinophagaceae bacterium]